MTAEEFVPSTGDLGALAKAAAHCQGCELYRDATQTVFGRGDRNARFVLIGEQPGDQEDRRGEPFVGPAGALLDRALAEAGIDPGETYVTNAVKHFRWKRAGKRRIHEKPGAAHINACRPWLLAELSRLRPDVIVLLGATAGQALFGPKFRVGASRGVPVDWQADDGPKTTTVATVHPSAVLRAPDRDAAYAGLLADLRTCAGLVRK
ncbi:UdgX family uracil-DNA binding protein [Actinocrinis sp.]|uniref:UdgX family uracil-DNA binding protein n=1 Tax=Actinocrinis sp. TaxID=1920516 RepID=UPI002BEBE697|nr:UdgX family uracil-DNA binding protein [Actinocrinis sp.]HXR71375.1 UdgX family uracil-DNA binding protein [Actinocrinis sp.]